MNAVIDRKNELIKAARILFAKKGYAATSVKDIAQEADVNVALISYYFEGKEGLYKACLDEFAAEKMNFLERYVLKPKSAEDFKHRLRIFLEQMLHNEIENPDAGCIIRRDVESDDPIVLEIFRKTILQLHEAFVSFIKSGQDSGFIKKDIKPQILASLFMGGIQHEIRTDHIKKKFYGNSIRDEKYRNEMIEAALEMFLNGVQR